MTTMRPFTLGSWRVEPASGTVSSGTHEERLEPRVMSVLCLLARRQGEVVSHDELLDAVWESRFVGANTLSQAIHRIRRALGDSALEPCYVETIHKRGYRLIREVRPSDRDRPAPRSASRRRRDPVLSLDDPSFGDPTLDGLVDRLEQAFASVLHDRALSRPEPGPAPDERLRAAARGVADSIAGILRHPVITSSSHPLPGRGEGGRRLPGRRRTVRSRRRALLSTSPVRLRDLPLEPSNEDGFSEAFR